jgi:hypothetical protein
MPLDLNSDLHTFFFKLVWKVVYEIKGGSLKITDA